MISADDSAGGEVAVRTDEGEGAAASPQQGSRVSVVVVVVVRERRGGGAVESWSRGAWMGEAREKESIAGYSMDGVSSG